MEQTLFKIFDKFWGVTEKKDEANHATQHLPEGIREGDVNEVYEA